MMRSLATAATGMIAQELKLDVTANNIANANTTGFKRARPEFEEVFVEQLRNAEAPDQGRPAALEVGLGVRAGSTTRSFEQGEMLNTQNPLDLAIEGQGFLPVRLDNGELGFTRAGNLRVDAQGKLVTQEGRSLDPQITLPENATSITIERDGRVRALVEGRTDPVDVGSIELATFTNPGGLESLGGNLMKATEASGEAQMKKPGDDGAGAIAQGFLEGSNVKTVEEMIDLITTQRAYEMSSKVIQSADQMLQRLTNLR
jgi:flagellar basal-body rod protein FlgG